jgi:NAD(P)-dependent dehydrogenase (short-subunit alcohol dehydrogenase family)
MRVVVTGAGSGIGRETALAFAREGAEVVVSDIDEATAKETAAQIAARGDVDLHKAVDLLRQGCPPEIALRILP